MFQFRAHALANKLAAKTVHAIKQHPAIRMTGEQHRQTFANAGTALAQGSTRRVHEVFGSVTGEAKRLEATIDAARRKRRQHEALAGLSGGALLIAILLSPFLAGLLPVWDGRKYRFVCSAT